MIILDGIAMGTTRQVPVITTNVDVEQIYPTIPLTERIFVGDSKLRDRLKQYTKLGLLNYTFDCLLCDLQIPEFARYLDVTSKVHGALKIVDPELYSVTEVIQLLSRCETLTALIRISALSENQRTIISELSLGKCVASDDLENIYKKPLVYKLL